MALALKKPAPGGDPDIPAMFTEAILELANNPREPDGYIHASAILSPGDVCMKQLQFQALKAPVEKTNMPPALAWAVMRGTAFHRILEEAGNRMRAETEVQYRNEDLNLSATVDMLLSYGGERWIVEHKSCSEEQYRYLSAPLSRNVYQVHAQMLATGVDRAMLFYVPSGVPRAHTVRDLLMAAKRVSFGTVRDDIDAILERVPPPQKPARQMFAFGKAFRVEKEETTTGEVVEMCEQVRDGNTRGEWLSTNTNRCVMCPYTKVCFDAAVTPQSLAGGK